MIDTAHDRKRRFSEIRCAATSTAVAILVALVVAVAQSAQAQAFSVLYNFNDPDGAFPYGSLVRDAAGNLYGTTQVGGFVGSGTVFKLDTNGIESVLYSFSGGDDGGYPLAGLVLDAAGNLYGTTESGGSSGQGTVFKVTKAGVETVLHSFDGTDGCIPLGGLVRDAAGNLYGTTNSCGSSGVGTVFKLSKTGKEKVLHNFAGTNHGWGISLLCKLITGHHGESRRRHLGGWGRMLPGLWHRIQTGHDRKRNSAAQLHRRHEGRVLPHGNAGE